MGEELNTLLELRAAFNGSPCKFLVFCVPNRLHKVAYLLRFNFHTGSIQVPIEFWNEEDISFVKNQYFVIEFMGKSLGFKIVLILTPTLITILLRLNKNLLC